MSSDTERTLATIGFVVSFCFALLTMTAPLAFDIGPFWWRCLFCTALVGMIGSAAIWTHWRFVRGSEHGTRRLVLMTPVALILISGSMWICAVAPYPRDYLKDIYAAVSSRPTRPQQSAPPRIPNMLTLFMEQRIHGAIEYNWGSIKLMHGNVVVGIYDFFFRVLYDFDAKAKYVSYYLPPVRPDGMPFVLSWIAKRNSGYLLRSHRIPFVEKGNGDSDFVNSDQFQFTGRVFIYYENPLSIEQIADATKDFRSHGAQAEFRGADYAVLVWNSMVAHHVPSLPEYRITGYDIQMIPNSGTPVNNATEKTIWECPELGRVGKPCDTWPTSH